jgi:hypothetical protein
MAASNTHECFEEFLGQRLIGLLFNAMPANRADLRAGNRHLIFEDGRALTLSDSGSYWIDSEKDVRRAIEAKKRELDQNSKEIEAVLELAAAMDTA